MSHALLTRFLLASTCCSFVLGGCKSTDDNVGSDLRSSDNEAARIDRRWLEGQVASFTSLSEQVRSNWQEIADSMVDRRGGGRRGDERINQNAISSFNGQIEDAKTKLLRFQFQLENILEEFSRGDDQLVSYELLTSAQAHVNRVMMPALTHHLPESVEFVRTSRNPDSDVRRLKRDITNFHRDLEEFVDYLKQWQSGGSLVPSLVEYTTNNFRTSSIMVVFSNHESNRAIPTLQPLWNSNCTDLQEKVMAYSRGNAVVNCGNSQLRSQSSEVFGDQNHVLNSMDASITVAVNLQELGLVDPEWVSQSETLRAAPVRVSEPGRFVPSNLAVFNAGLGAFMAACHRALQESYDSKPNFIVGTCSFTQSQNERSGGQPQAIGIGQIVRYSLVERGTL